MGPMMTRNLYWHSQMREPTMAVLPEGAGHGGFAEAAAGIEGQFDPLADEGFDAGGDLEEVLEDGLEALGIAGHAGEAAGVMELGGVGDGVAEMAALHAVAHEGGDVFGDAVVLEVLVGDGLLVDGPGAVEEGGDAVMEHIRGSGRGWGR